MKAIFIPLMMIACNVYAQVNEPDSLPAMELNEVTVVSTNQRADSQMTVYIPDSHQRLAASGGVSLLALMNIPQLDVNPMSETVKTADNRSVDVFINFHPASQEDIAGLNPMNVKRVEYMDFPTDPRFMRSQHVVNFITRELVFGGYTKVSARQSVIVNIGDASVYSKFRYKSMMYDVMVNGEWENNSETGSKANDIYQFPGLTIERASDVFSGKERHNNVFAGVRASWEKSENFSFRNLLTITSNRTPVSNTTGKVELLPGGQAENFLQDNKVRNSHLELGSELYSALSCGWSLNGNIDAEYNDNNIGSSYSAGQTDITNNAQENSWFLHGNFQINKALNEKMTLFSNIISGGGITKIKYSGYEDVTNTFRPFFGGVSVGMGLNVNKFSGSVDAGFAYESSTINKETVHDCYPFTHINLQYSPDQRNTSGIWFQYAAFSPEASMKNPNTIQQNEVLFISGNPDLHCSKHITASVSHTYLPCNTWQLTAYVTMFRIMGRQVPVYMPEGPGGMMLKKYYNDGNYNHGQVGARISGKFLKGSLNASLSPRLLLYHTTGTNRVSRYPFCMGANVDYYTGSFFFNIYWSSAFSYVDGETCYLRKLPSEYSLTAGWADKGWNIKVSVTNIFRSSWRTSRDVLRSEYFDSKVVQFGADYHRRLSTSISYTFNYGRKVNAADELINTNSGSSSILR